MPSTRLILTAALLLGVPLAPTPGARAVEAPGSLTLVVANAQEGAAGRFARDLRDDTDRQALTRRIAAGTDTTPDVVLLQEVRGSMPSFVTSLSRPGAPMRATAKTHASVGVVRCGDHRRSSFPLVRSSAILVNTAAVTIRQTGVVETWGLLGEHGSKQLDANAGCTEHPWALLEYDGRSALVLNLHLSPRGTAHKNRGLARISKEVTRLARVFDPDLVAVGGDFNLTRCTTDPRSPESLGCGVRRGHRAFLQRGFTDALRAADPAAVSGASRRIEFLYTTGSTVSAWQDRCYRGWMARGCASAESVFPSPSGFYPCKRRSLLRGRPGKNCPSAMYSRYYSDHPVLAATVR